MVGFAPGGTTDLLARIIADELRANLEHRGGGREPAGADGIVATTAVHQAPARRVHAADEHECPGDHART